MAAGRIDPNDPDLDGRLRAGLGSKLDPRNHFDGHEAFDAFMQSVDSDLRARGIPIVARELHAMREVAVRLHTDIYGVPPRLAKPGDYSSISLSAHVTTWFRNRYGSRLNIGRSGGSTVVVIAGDFYRADIPMVFGRPKFIFDPSLRDWNTHQDLRAINVARLVRGLTEPTARRLDQPAQTEVVARVAKGVALGQLLNSLEGRRFVAEAMGDLKQAVELLFAEPPLPGPSRWASLQFSEKCLKAFLQATGSSIPRSHDLAKLLRLTVTAGLRPPRTMHVDRIQCDAGVRYESGAVTIADAASAHWESQELGLVVLPRVRPASS